MHLLTLLFDYKAGGGGRWRRILIGWVSATNVGIAVIGQSVSLVSIRCSISTKKWTLGIGSGQETHGGQSQFNFRAAGHGDGAD